MHARCMAEDERHVCTFYLWRPSTRASREKTLPSFKQLPASAAPSLRRPSAGTTPSVRSIPTPASPSHRWMELGRRRRRAAGAAVREYLSEHPEIQVWYDWCMPRERKARVQFSHMPGTSTCSTGMRVLILLDLSYMSRF